jgi:hypothetical protein
MLLLLDWWWGFVGDFGGFAHESRFEGLELVTHFYAVDLVDSSGGEGSGEVLEMGTVAETEEEV